MRCAAPGVESRVQSALRIDQVAEPYIRGRALRHLEERKVVIFAAGTGNPFFTTDTAAALRGREMGVDIVLKATKVDGVYTADPMKDATATRYLTLTFDEAIVKNLKVMDATALALCRDQNMLLKVFSIFVPGALKRVVMGARRRHAGALLGSFGSAWRTHDQRRQEIRRTEDGQVGRGAEGATWARSAPAARTPACSTTSTSTTTAR